MHLGVALFATDLTSDIRDVARAAEDAGFESLFVAEHTHIPTSRRTPYPMGGELPPEYARTYDPFVALTAAAAVTEKLRLGTGVCLVVERDPIVLAKEVATPRRALRRAHAVRRRRRLERRRARAPRRRVRRPLGRAARTGRADAGAVDAGRGVVRRQARRLEPSWQWPKPVQPQVPVLVGGGGQAGDAAGGRLPRRVDADAVGGRSSPTGWRCWPTSPRRRTRRRRRSPCTSCAPTATC